MPYIFPTESIMSQLQNANKDYYGRKTWENLYGNIDLARQSEIGALQQDYSQSVLDTYESAYRAKQNVMASNLGQGYKLAGTSDIDLAAADAYEAFRQNYMSGASKVNQAYGEQTAAVTSALQSEAENYSSLLMSYYDFLEDLSKDETSQLYTNTAFKDYLANITEDVVNQETGEITTKVSGQRLKTWDELVSEGMFEYDSQGNMTITQKGMDFYSNIAGLIPSTETGITKTHSTWLYETNPGLYNWAMSVNPYDYSKEGTKYGSFKELTGIDDREVVGSKYPSELSSTEVADIIQTTTNWSTLLNDFREYVNSDALDNLNDLAAIGDFRAEGSKILDSLIQAYPDIEAKIEELGLASQVELVTGMNMKELKKAINAGSSASLSWVDSMGPDEDTVKWYKEQALTSANTFEKILQVLDGTFQGKMTDVYANNIYSTYNSKLTEFNDKINKTQGGVNTKVAVNDLLNDADKLMTVASSIEGLQELVEKDLEMNFADIKNKLSLYSGATSSGAELLFNSILISIGYGSEIEIAEKMITDAYKQNLESAKNAGELYEKLLNSVLKNIDPAYDDSALNRWK